MITFEVQGEQGESKVTLRTRVRSHIQMLKSELDEVWGVHGPYKVRQSSENSRGEIRFLGRWWILR